MTVGLCQTPCNCWQFRVSSNHPHGVTVAYGAGVSETVQHRLVSWCPGVLESWYFHCRLLFLNKDCILKSPLRPPRDLNLQARDQESRALPTEPGGRAFVATFELRWGLSARLDPPPTARCAVAGARLLRIFSALPSFILTALTLCFRSSPWPCVRTVRESRSSVLRERRRWKP